MSRTHLVVFISLFCITSCKKNTQSNEPTINFIFRFDSTQERLNNIGEPELLPATKHNHQYLT